MQMEQSTIEDIHAKQFEIQSNPVCKYSEDVFLVEVRTFQNT